MQPKYSVLGRQSLSLKQVHWPVASWTPPIKPPGQYLIPCQDIQGCTRRRYMHRKKWRLIKVNIFSQGHITNEWESRVLPPCLTLRNHTRAWPSLAWTLALGSLRGWGASHDWPSFVHRVSMSNPRGYGNLYQTLSTTHYTLRQGMVRKKQSILKSLA